MKDKCEESGTFKYNCTVYEFKSGSIGSYFTERYYGGSNEIFVSVVVPEEIYVLIKNMNADMLDWSSNDNVIAFHKWLNTISLSQVYDDMLIEGKLLEYLGDMEWKFKTTEELIEHVTKKIIEFKAL